MPTRFSLTTAGVLAAATVLSLSAAASAQESFGVRGPDRSLGAPVAGNVTAWSEFDQPAWRQAGGADNDGGGLVNGDAGGVKGNGPPAADVRMPAIDLTAIHLEDAALDGAPGMPMRNGIVRSIDGGPITPDTHGTWSRTAAGELIWDAVIEIPEAWGARLNFQAFDLPAGARLVVGNDNGAQDVYSDMGPLRSGTFWAPAVAGERIRIQYQGGNNVVDLPAIMITDVAHLYRGFDVPFAQDDAAGGAGGDAGYAGDCFVDVTCEDTDDVARDSVGRMSWIEGGGSFLCTGGLINDQDENNFAGWFLTANHCINTQAAINTLTVYWFYESSLCDGGTPSLASRPKSVGGTLIHNSSASDFTFIRLADDPNEGQGFAGYNIFTPSVTVTGIHHPGGAKKHFSQGPRTSAGPICGGLPQSRFWYLDWTTGMTAGGSSGSPLFNSNWQVVGQLFGSCGNYDCGTQASANVVYGKIGYAWNFISDELTGTTPDDEHEDNDVIEDASPISEGSHDLRLVDFYDYFSVELDGTGDISASVSSNPFDIDVRLFLRRVDNSVLDFSVNGGALEEVDATGLDAGTYIIQVQKWGGWDGDYTLDIDLNVTGTPCPADFDGDESVGFGDLVSMLGAYGSCPGCPQDLDGDDLVTFADIVAILAAWGPCPG